MDPAEALAELKQISTQISCAVIVRDGVLEAATVAGPAAAQMAAAADRLWAASERARVDLGRPGLVQLQVGMPEGSVFAVRDGDRLIAATTPPDPPVGLVLYDLKTCLRGLVLPASADAAEAVDDAEEPA